jgi:hypothetical protein
MVRMKIFKANVEVICGEYSFLDTRLLVCRDSVEAERLANEQATEENSMYPGETFYKLQAVEELNFLDNYEVEYSLKEQS